MANSATALNCSCALEHLSKNGTVLKTTKIKTVSVHIMRNEFRDIFIQVNSRDFNQKFLLNGVIIHKKFAHEGKTTFKFPDQCINLFISNAPPTLLSSFLKTLFVKLSSSKSSPKVPIRDRLLSVKQQSTEEISPISTKDINRVQNTDVTPKRKRNQEGLTKESKRICLQPLTSLTEEQERVLQAVLQGSNVFFTGSAGTGKSFLLHHILNSLQPAVTIATASTGSAACLIGGTTLHSFAGIGSGEGTLERCLNLASRPFIQQNWRKCKHLIIDEISMIEAELFQKIEWVARQVRNNDKPFGGIQLIICGDFLQLPPVSKEKNKFCFMSDAWETCRFKTFYLKQVHRQSDQEFISLLNDMRFGIVTQDTVKKLKETETQSIEKEGVLATRLCCHTKEANLINASKLEKLPGASKIYEATDSSAQATKLLDECTPVEKRFVLKEGSQVMLLKNISISQGLVNGARGVIDSFSNGLPVVKFLTGVKHVVKQEKWSVKTASGVVHVRQQLPLKLAWAFSIHKSQGLTLDCVEISLDNTFEAGQAYVALSRAKSLNSIRVIGFQSNQVWANQDVIQFYKRLLSYEQEYIRLGTVDKKNKTVKKKSIPLVTVR